MEDTWCYCRDENDLFAFLIQRIHISACLSIFGNRHPCENLDCGQHLQWHQQISRWFVLEDLGFDIDIFMLDSNARSLAVATLLRCLDAAFGVPHFVIPWRTRIKVMDAHGLDDRPGSNLCHRRYNAQDRRGWGDMVEAGRRGAIKDQDARSCMRSNKQSCHSVLVAVEGHRNWTLGTHFFWHYMIWAYLSSTKITAESKLAYLEGCTADLLYLTEDLDRL